MSVYMRVGTEWKPVLVYRLFAADAGIPIWERVHRVWRVAGASWQPEANPAPLVQVSSLLARQMSESGQAETMVGEAYVNTVDVVAGAGCQSAAFWYRTSVDPPGRWDFLCSAARGTDSHIRASVSYMDGRKVSWCVTAFAGPVTDSRDLPGGPQGVTLKYFNET